MYSKESYRDLLKQALDLGYQFISFFDEPPADAPFIYLRHDVDASLKMALEMAEINHSLGIRATFFMLLRSKMYNLLAYPALDFVQAIHEAGQDLGFHFAQPPNILASPDAIAALVQADYAHIRQAVPPIRPIFSWHNTTPDILEWSLHHDVPGLLNAYSQRFFKDIPYYSDSLTRHTPADFEIILRRGHAAMQLLFHPEIWMGGGANLREISAQVWGYVIRERDHDPTGTDPTVARHVPNRIPDRLLDDLKNAFIQQEDPDP
jgi:hypothetical protein